MSNFIVTSIGTFNLDRCRSVHLENDQIIISFSDDDSRAIPFNSKDEAQQAYYSINLGLFEKEALCRSFVNIIGGS